MHSARLPALPAISACLGLQAAQCGRDTARSQVDASKKQIEQLEARFSNFEQHEQELLGQLASAEAGMRGSRVTSSRLLQEGQRLELTVRMLP
jgi:phage shock protein A